MNVSPRDAFEVFTEQTDAWWRRGPRFRFGDEARGVLRFEGGRARHGLDGSALSDMIGLWWGDVVTSYRAHIARLVRTRP